jgi:hypothetical protein
MLDFNLVHKGKCWGNKQRLMRLWALTELRKVLTVTVHKGLDLAHKALRKRNRPLTKQLTPLMVLGGEALM